MLRTRTCGELRAADIGQEVTLCGWADTIRNLGNLVFIDIRDKYGITQLNVPPSLFEKQPLKSEYCFQAVGIVKKRENPNPNLATGYIEVAVSQIRIFSSSDLPPFSIRDDTTALEDTRLEYRYLDLRRPKMQHYLKIRSDLAKYAREYLYREGFQEIDTPTLIKSTPEGARDFLVPSRTFKGSFYALPQSPQLYKQLLMVAGCDRYFQLAHCYRDEDQRADRQPEFMQIDCEMSFVDREDVLNIIEGLIKYIFEKTIGVELPQFARIDYKDAIDRYGSDKPDLRFEMLLSDVTDILCSCGFRAYEGKSVIALKVADWADKVSRSHQSQDDEMAKKYGAHGVAHLKYQSGAFTGSMVKNIDPSALNDLRTQLSVSDNDLVILCADSDDEVAKRALGALRLKYGRECGLIDPECYRPLFVINWPMFAKTSDGYECLSNPFTKPLDEDLIYLDSAPEKVRSAAYDTVLNGVELSSGALRIHDSEVQKKVFEIIGLSDEDIEERFGFLVKALRYGVPPEGGFGIGIERLAMELAHTDNVRDVVAFPKNLKGAEPMSACPSPVPKEDTDVLGIRVIDGEDDG